MSEPILAKDVLIQFLSGSDYILYGCAAELSTEFSMETKSVKTIGDGVWRRKRGQSLGQIINLSGVVKNDTSVVDAFDLLTYFKNMADVSFKIFFYDETGVAKLLKGNGLPTNVNFSSGSEGFTSGEITIEVNGDPDYVDPVAPPPPDPNDPNDCAAEIETAHVEFRSVPGSFVMRRYAVIDSMVSGSADISRWDYTLDGGGVLTAFTDGTIPAAFILPSSVSSGSHTIVITPICANGFPGTSFTIDFP